MKTQTQIEIPDAVREQMRRGGLTRMAQLSPEERRALGRKAFAARCAKHRPVKARQTVHA